MRYAFGLAGVLIVIGVIVVIMSNYTLPTAKTAIQTKKKVEERFGGNTSEGLADQKASIALTDMTAGGRFEGLYVKSVVAGGFMQSKFGLAADDIIVQIGDLHLRGQDSEMAEALLWEARMKQWNLKVIRNQQEVTLTPK